MHMPLRACHRCACLPLRPRAGTDARTYPDRPIHLVVAFVPGGATDTLARQISNDLQEALGQPVVIENRPGAGGYLAWNHVASSEPDGYTLLLAENALAISQALYKKSKSSFDPLTQYDAIAGDRGLALGPGRRQQRPGQYRGGAGRLFASTVPQKMNYASAGIGSVSHLNFEVFKDKTGMEAVHVPYKGGGQAIGDVIAGHVPMTITSVQAAKGLVESGKVKALAVTSSGPLAGDAGRADHAGGRRAAGRCRAAASGLRIFGPKGMPEPVKAKLTQAVAKVMTDPRVRERLAKLDITPGRRAGPGAAHQARKRDQELDGVHRRHGIRPE